ncbi:MAG: type I-MYXAN CRISPR-associated protein Cas6/Cmx6 [Pyrinomonadaceae bacterium]
MNSSSSGVATIRELTQPHINVTFALSGKQIPADHGYLLYSAIARATGSAGVSAGSAGILPASDRSAGILPASTGTSVPPVSALHKTDWLAIELISGFPSGPGLIALSDRGATLHLRIPAEHYRDVLPLAGKRLDIGGHQLRLGLPVARPLEPAPSLYARVVTIKKFTEPEPFLDAVNRQLDSLGAKGTAELPRDEQGRYRRRIVTIHGKSVVGFSVAVKNQRLSASLNSPRINHRMKQGTIPSDQRLSAEVEAGRNRRRVGTRGKRCTSPVEPFTHPDLLAAQDITVFNTIPTYIFLDFHHNHRDTSLLTEVIAMFVDLSFRVIGNEIPIDHGYALYGSLSRFQPSLHQADWLAVHPINGLVVGNGELLISKDSRLRLRLPMEKLPEVMPLAGKRLEVVSGKRGGLVHIGTPEIYSLRPSESLYSHCVTIKVSEVEEGRQTPSREMLLAAARKQLDARGITGDVWVDDECDATGRERSRRILRIKDRVIVGYAVTVLSLSDEDSLKLQQSGLGGRQRMGCGIFTPVKREAQRSR